MLKDKKRHSTIVDVAKIAGVSNITVSRAFSKPELVNKETREKIYEVAKQINYSQNLFASSLKTSKSKIIGFISDSTYNPVYINITKTLCLKADAEGYSVMMFETNGNPEVEERAVDTLLKYQASGIILSPYTDAVDYKPEYLKKIKASKIPLVILDRDFHEEDLPGVFIDNFDVGKMAGEYLAKKEAQDVLIIAGPKNSYISQKRIEGILSTLLPKIENIHFLYTNYSYEKARPNIYNYLKDIKQIPEWIVSINGLIGLAAIGICKSLGYKSTRYFSIDAIPYALDFGYKIPCVCNDQNEWGEKIQSLLFSMIEGTRLSESNRRIFIRGKIHE